MFYVPVVLIAAAIVLKKMKMSLNASIVALENISKVDIRSILLNRLSINIE
jgi:hypothetical protein